MVGVCCDRLARHAINVAGCVTSEAFHTRRISHAQTIDTRPGSKDYNYYYYYYFIDSGTSFPGNKKLLCAEKKLASWNGPCSSSSAFKNYRVVE